MARILEAQTFDVQEAAKGHTYCKAKGVALIDITGYKDNLDTLAGHIDNAYSYKTYDVKSEDIPTGVALFLTQDKTCFSQSNPAPIADDLKQNISGNTFLSKAVAELSPVKDAKAIWSFSPVGTALACPVQDNDRITVDGKQIWPRKQQPTPTNTAPKFKR